MDKKELQSLLQQLAEGPSAILVKKDLPRGNSVYFLKPLIYQERLSGREDDEYIANLSLEGANLSQLQKQDSKYSSKLDAIEVKLRDLKNQRQYVGKTVAQYQSLMALKAKVEKDISNLQTSPNYVGEDKFIQFE